MKYFLIKALKGAKEDRFMMKESIDFVLFTAFGLKDLEQTLKGVLPKGYRIATKETLSRRLRKYDGFQIRSVFNIPMIEVIEIKNKPKIEKEIEFFNKSRGRSYNLKTVDNLLWDSIENKPVYQN